MKKVFYTIAVLTISLMLCDSNSDDETTIPDASNILPTQVAIVNSNGETETIRYKYHGMTPIKEEYSNGDYRDYIYEDGKLTENNTYNSKSAEILESYAYDAQGRVATISTNIVDVGVYDYNLSYNADNSVITYTYKGSPDYTSDVNTIKNGNLVIADQGDIDTSRYTYDSNNAPFKNIANRAILLTIASENNNALNFTLNNVLTEDISESTASNDESPVYTYTYTSFDFPRTIEIKEGNDITTYTFSYNND